jgi:DNA mismatch endonuclease (patch repair protein)
MFTKSKRSQVMAAIRSSGNRDTELKLASLLKKYGITGWRRNQPVFGKPDFIFRRQKVAVFVDGCFWHGCPKCYRRPRSNKKYWNGKVVRNKARDRHVNRNLSKLDWRVVRIWEHDLAKRGEACVLKIQAVLTN